jgi:hypothetical protein
MDNYFGGVQGSGESNVFTKSRGLQMQNIETISLFLTIYKKSTQNE